MYTKFEKNNEENAFIRDGYICSDKVYRCKRDIVCSNGIFSKGGLVMLEGADDKGIIEIADFAEISRAVVSEHADDYRCGYYCGYTDNGLDTFRVDPKRISNFFEEEELEVTHAVQELWRSMDKSAKSFWAVPIYFILTTISLCILTVITESQLIAILSGYVDILGTVFLALILFLYERRKLYSMQKCIYEKFMKRKEKNLIYEEKKL